MATFEERLRLLRQEKNITQKQLSEIIKTTERGFRNYEIGKSKPNYEILLKIANYFNVSLDYIVGRSDNPTRT